MKLRIYFAGLLLLTLFLAWVGEQFIRDPGYVLINYAGYVIETSVWLPIVLMVLGSGVIILLWEISQRLLSSPAGFRRWWIGRGVKSTHKKTLLSLIELTEQLTQAPLQLNQQQQEKCQASLQRLQTIAPHNKQIIKLLAQIQQRIEN